MQACTFFGCWYFYSFLFLVVFFLWFGVIILALWLLREKRLEVKTMKRLYQESHIIHIGLGTQSMRKTMWIFSLKEKSFGEREIKLNQLKHFCIPHIFEQQHQLNLCFGFPLVPDEIILEFYANMFECNSLENSFHIFICGRIFSIDVDVIATTLEIPCVLELGYLSRNDLDKDVVLSWFCGRRRCLGTSENAKFVGFTNEVCLLNKIMGANLFPLSQGNTIIVERDFFSLCSSLWCSYWSTFCTLSISIGRVLLSWLSSLFVSSYHNHSYPHTFWFLLAYTFYRA